MFMTFTWEDIFYGISLISIVSDENDQGSPLDVEDRFMMLLSYAH